MKLSDLLVDDCVVIPAEAPDLRGVLDTVLGRACAHLRLDEDRAAKMARSLSIGGQGEVVRVHEDVLVVMGSLDSLEGPCLGMAIAPTPFAVGPEGRNGPGEARVVFLTLTPGRFSGVRHHLVPALMKVFRDPAQVERLLSVASAADVRDFGELMDVQFRARLLVEDALVPVRYRVYPDTPVREVVDLMVRRKIRAVPVVGERYEVLGILTSGDALTHLINRGHPEERDEDVEVVAQPRAKEVMTRSVLCVSEEQALVDAANTMVHRDVEQLPVVRDGELVGFVTRDSILLALYGHGETATDNPKRERESTE